MGSKVRDDVGMCVCSLGHQLERTICNTRDCRAPPIEV
jgi:hypothetical protein